MRRSALLGFVLLLATDALAASARVIPPGREAAVQALLAPMSDTHPVGGGWRLETIGIDKDVIKLGFQKDGESVALVVAHGDTSEGRVAGPVRLVGDGPLELVEAVRTVLATKAGADLPWTEPSALPKQEAAATPAAEQRATVPLALQHAMLLGLMALLAGLTALVVVRAVRTAGFSAQVAAGLAAVTAAAAALRLTLSPRAFLHEYYHAADHLHDYLVRAGGFFLYGETGPAIYRLANALLGGDEQAVFTANLVFATLTVPALVLFVRAVSGRWTEAFVAGVLLAVLPLHLRFSASEELSMPALLFATWALVLVARFVETRGLPELLGATLATALTMQCRPELLAFAAVPPALALALVPVRSWRGLAGWRTASAAVLLAVLSLPRVVELLGNPTHRPAGFHPAGALELVAFFDPDAVGVGAWLLLAAGLAWGLRHRTALTAVLATTAAFWVAVSLAFFQNPPPYNQRTQMIALAFLLPLCAQAVPFGASLLARLGTRAGVAAAAACVVLAASGLPGRTAWLGTLYDAQEEWAFLVETVPTLPSSGTLIATVDRRTRTLDAFPTMLLERHGRALHTLSLEELSKEQVGWPKPGRGLLFYQGMNCHFAFADEPPPDPLSARCRAVHDRYELRPLATRTITAPPYSRLTYAPGPWTVGFYELVGLRRHEAGGGAPD